MKIIILLILFLISCKVICQESHEGAKDMEMLFTTETISQPLSAMRINFSIGTSFFNLSVLNIEFLKYSTSSTYVSINSLIVASIAIFPGISSDYIYFSIPSILFYIPGIIGNVGVFYKTRFGRIGVEQRTDYFIPNGKLLLNTDSSIYYGFVISNSIYSSIRYTHNWNDHFNRIALNYLGFSIGFGFSQN